jgi:hypothetical protein
MKSYGLSKIEMADTLNCPPEKWPNLWPSD